MTIAMHAAKNFLISLSHPFRGIKKVRPHNERRTEKVSTLIVATQSQSSRKGTNEMSKERKHFLPKQFSLNDLNILDCVALIV
jgi:hypothetical protein